MVKRVSKAKFLAMSPAARRRLTQAVRAKKVSKGKGKYPRYKKKVTNRKRLFSYNNLEKKLIPYVKYESVAGNPNQKIACISLLNNGIGTGADYLISGVVIQTGDNLTSTNLAFNTTNGPICRPVGGFRVQSSIPTLPMTTSRLPTNRMIDGEYCNFISSKLNLHIQMNNELIDVGDLADEGELARVVQEQNTPTTFRLIAVRARRGHTTAENVQSPHGDQIPSLQSNLFIDDVGNEVGMNSLGAVQQKFRWRVNKRKFVVLGEKYFKLANIAGTIRAQGQSPSGNTGQLLNNITRHRTEKHVTCRVPVPKGKCKIAFDFNDTLDDHPLGVPQGFNYVVHHVLLACKPGDNLRSNDWSVSTYGQTTLVDL